MSTLGVLVVSLMAINFNQSPEDSRPALLYENDQNAIFDASPMNDPVTPDEPGAAEKPDIMMLGESYYMPTYQNSPCRHPGFYVGAELALLKPYLGNAADERNSTSVTRTIITSFVQLDYLASPRVWLGYTSRDGLGVRIRWWQFDQTGSENVSVEEEWGPAVHRYDGVNTGGFDVNVLDAEVIDSVFLNQKWELMFSGGFRYAKFDWTHSSEGKLKVDYNGNTTVSSIVYSYSEDFEGVGATAALQLRRGCCKRLGLFANARGSLLYGDQQERIINDSEQNPLPIPATDFRLFPDTVRAIWEAQLGVDWTCELYHGLYFTSRVAGEAQYWNAMNNGQDVGFSGFTVAVGLIR